MRNFPAQAAPSGEPVSDSASWTSSNANDTMQEEQNAITSSGQTLIALAAAAVNTQLSQAMARYASGGLFGVDSGAANAYVVGATGTFTPPDAYFDGMVISFYPINNPTGASTVNAFGIGVKDIKNKLGLPIIAGDFNVTTLTNLRFDQSNDYFIADDVIIRGLFTRDFVQSIPDGVDTDVFWQLDEYDNGSMRSSGDIIIPAGITMARFVYQIAFVADAVGYRKYALKKNSSEAFAGSAINLKNAIPAGAVFTRGQGSTGWLDVAAADSFTVGVTQTSGFALDVDDAVQETWFSVELK